MTLWRPAVRRHAALATIALACTSPAEPATSFPATAAQFTPPPQYALWWQMTEACSATAAPFAAVRWYRVPGSALPPGSVLDTPGAEGATYFDASGARVVLADSFAGNARLVRHEMLHALLGRSVAGDHPATAFRTRCGGVVACDGPCAAETGRDTLPPPGTPVVDVSALVVTTALAGVPIHLSPGGRGADSGAVPYYGGYYAVTASVRNPRPMAVWARVRVFPYNPAAAATFGLVFAAADPAKPAGGPYLYVTADSVPFGPGETKRFAFDEQAMPSNPRPGTTVRAFFNSDTAAAALSLIVVP